MAQNLIYCFSGTGNGLNAAITIAKEQEDTQIISMKCNPEEVPATDAETIGFIFPVYHWSLPEHAKIFIRNLNININSYIYAIATCGGWSVNALNDFAEIIHSKGAQVSFSTVHKCVANYVVEYEPFPNPARQLPKSEKELVEIVHQIVTRATSVPPRKTIRKEFLRLLEKPFVRALPTKDNHFEISSECISCGLCARICITNNIEMKNGIPTFQHNCAQCMSCIAYCPKGAINYLNRTQSRTKYHHPNITAAQIGQRSMTFSCMKSKV